MSDLTGRVALVTGAASGIGRATARALAAAGASVVIADVDEVGGQQTAQLIDAEDRVAVVQADVSDESAVELMIAFVVECFGRLDLACNVAGISLEPKRFVDVTQAEWQRVIAVDLTGLFLCMQHEIRQMLGQGTGGAIVNVSSGAGVVPAPGQPHYTAAKHGVLGLTKQAAQEYAGAGIRVNAVLPGQTETEPMKAYLAAQPDHGERLLRRMPMGRMAQPAEIADSIAWLCSDASSYVNGVSLLVDGGQIAMTHLNPYSYEFHEDPFTIYRDLRDNAPCYHNPELGFWAISRYDDVLSALHDPVAYCSRYGITLEQDNSLPMLLTTDPPAHTDLRRLVSRAFTPRRVADLEPEIRTLSQRFLDGLLAKSEADLVADYAARLPMDVIARMLGVPESDEEELRVWTNTLLDRDEGVPDVTPDGVVAATNLYKYFCDFVAERRAAVAAGNAPDDLTTALCQAGTGDDALDDQQVVGFLFLLIIAGNETTTKLLANCLLALQRFPEERRKIVADPGRIPDAIEEILRFEGSTQLMARTLTRPVELHGETMPEGDKVLLLLGSANRDERVWDRPDEFGIDRASPVQHVGFGHGIHVCLGAALARLEMRVSLEEIFRLMPDYEIDEGGCTRVHSGNVRGWAAVPIRARASAS